MLKKNARHLDFILIFMLITSASVATTLLYVDFLNIMRAVIIIVLPLLLMWKTLNILKKNKLNTHILFPSIMHLFLIFYGVGLAYFYNAESYLTTKIVIQLAVSLMLTPILAHILYDCIKEPQRSKFGLKYFSLYFFWHIFLVFSVGNINFSIPPSLTFYNSYGSFNSYSQGFTSLSAMSFLYFSALSFLQRKFGIIYPALAILSLILTFLGGARGELVFGIFVFMLMFFRFLSVKTLLLGFISLALFSVLFFQTTWWTELVIIERLAVVLDGNYGLRDYLFSKSFALMANEPNCVIFGCGFSYFQEYFSFESRFYPHNIILESMITFGLIITIPLIIFTSIGIYSMYVAPNQNPIFYLLLFQFFTLQKSGTLVHFWGLSLLTLFSFWGFIYFMEFLKKLQDKSSKNIHSDKILPI